MLCENEETLDKAHKLASSCYQLYRESDMVFDKISMYTYDRIADSFLVGVIIDLFERGLNEEQVIYILQSKAMRWGMDAGAEMVTECGKEFSKKHIDPSEFLDGV